MSFATSDWAGLHPTRSAAGCPVGALPAAAPDEEEELVEPEELDPPELRSPVTEEFTCVNQLPRGITRESSRIRRSQSNRTAARERTDAERFWATCAKSPKELSELARAPS